MELKVHNPNGGDQVVQSGNAFQDALAKRFATQGGSENPGNQSTPKPEVTPSSAPVPDSNQQPKAEEKTGKEEEPKKFFDKKKFNENFVPQARFNEVYSKVKTLEQENIKLRSDHSKKMQGLSEEDIQYRNELKKQGFVPEDEKDIYQTQKEIDKLNSQVIEEINKEISHMEKEFDGANGLPKFDAKIVVQYGLDNNIMNPRVAYKDMHFAEIVDYYVDKAVEEMKKTPSFSAGNSTHEPAQGRPQNVKIGSTSFKKYLEQRIKAMQT